MGENKGLNYLFILFYKKIVIKIRYYIFNVKFGVNKKFLNV